MDNNNFNNTLNQVIIKPVSFDYFEVREYLDDNYYTFTDNYEMSKGTVSITTENNKPVLIWRIDADFLSGNDETLSYEIEVVSNKKDSSGFYPINTNTKVLSRLMGMATYEQNDTNTLVLKAGYNFKGVVNTYLTSKPPASETDDSINYLSATMSPMNVQAQYLEFAAINAQTDYLENMRFGAQFSLRPVISLKNSTEYVSGDGTMINPYIIN